ncbi:Surface antigen [Hartmannibacter diazotrophicus]|uniref:17 kDa surface antigen n=1 Tax=Hartmannibacter diazotrophicus TaxID=1482074 RepID=A0A2C9D407_9HYPH|nr:RT0821/Lpp0805 family surface protein [Hartmannibacter diazotrophicus]SON54898.1 Surface antigen [Hartmannibacter diazotrophicus]
MLTKNLIAVGMIGAALAGCASDPQYGGGNKAGLGTLAGAVAGGAIGSAFGQGSGKVAAIAGGALLGGFLGNQIGARLDEEDRQRAMNAQYYALESGTPQQWTNQNTGRYGAVSVSPVQQINSSQCRSYTSTIYIDGQPQVSRGTACRNPDGTWQQLN